MDRSSLIIFTLTHVFYEKGNYVSFALAMTGLLPVVIVSCLVFDLWTQRRLQTLLVLFGLLVSEAINNMLKHYIKEPRPVELNYLFGLETGRWHYGMPSAHSQFISFFFATYPIMLRSDRSLVRRIIHFVVIGALTAGCLYSRAHFGYHTTAQVVVGGALGIILGLGYRMLCETDLCRKTMDVIEESRIGKFLMLHSIHHIDDSWHHTYTAARSARKQARD